MLVTLKDVEPCGVRSPGGITTIGVMHQDKPYYFENMAWMRKDLALEHYRNRLDHPRTPDESCILLETPYGFRLCLHQEAVVSVPYAEALKSICRLMRESGKLEMGITVGVCANSKSLSSVQRP